MVCYMPLKSRKRKPKAYADMTLEEKVRFHEREAKLSHKALTSRATSLPTDKLGRVKPGVRVQDYRPHAPRNPTQVSVRYVCTFVFALA